MDNVEQDFFIRVCRLHFAQGHGDIARMSEQFWPGKGPFAVQGSRSYGMTCEAVAFVLVDGQAPPKNRIGSGWSDQVLATLVLIREYGI